MFYTPICDGNDLGRRDTSVPSSSQSKTQLKVVTDLDSSASTTLITTATLDHFNIVQSLHNNRKAAFDYHSIEYRHFLCIYHLAVLLRK